MPMHEIADTIRMILTYAAVVCAAAVGVVLTGVAFACGARMLAQSAKKLAALSLVGAALIGGMVVVGTDDAGAKPSTNVVNQAESGTNTVGQTEGGGTNQVENVELKVENGGRGKAFLHSPLSTLHPITDEDIALGWRVASVSSNVLAAATFTMPTNATVWESAQAYGRGWGAWRIPLDGWHFTYGDVGWTNGFAWVEGYFRSKFRSRANEIRLLSERLTLCPAAHWSRYTLAASRAWSVANDVDGLVVTFENAAIGDDPAKIASVQMELFPRTGEVALRYDLTNVGGATYTAGLVVNGTNHFVEVGSSTSEVVFQRVHPFDWDMDGIPNSIDDTPREPSLNTGYNQTDAWAMAAFPSNSAEIATMGYAAWVAARAAETNRLLVALSVASANGTWPVCLTFGDKQVMCDGKAEMLFPIDRGARYAFSVSGGELASVSVPGVESRDTTWLEWYHPWDFAVGDLSVHQESASDGWMGCLASVDITLDGHGTSDFGRYDDAGGIFGHFKPGETHVLTGEVHQCHSNAFLDCTWSGGPGFVFASPHSLSTDVVWISTDGAAWATNFISLVTRYMGGYALTNTMMVCAGPEHVPPTGISISCQDVLFLNDDRRLERVYAVTVGLMATNGVEGEVVLRCNGADSTLSYMRDVIFPVRALTFPMGISSNAWFHSSRTVFMSCAEIGEGELSATIAFTNGTSCATSKVFNVIEPIRKLVNNGRYSPGHYYNPSRLVYGDRAYLRVGVNGYFDPGDVDWHVVSGPGHVVAHVGLLATVEATAEEGTVIVEARFNEDEIQPRFVLPIVKPRVIPVRAFVAPPPRRQMKRAWKESDILSRFDSANDIFSQVGITFDLLSIEYNFCSDTNWNMQATRTVRSTDGSNEHLITGQLGTLLDHYQTNDCIEVYFLGNFSPGKARGIYNLRGLALSRNSSPNAFPHELGHTLGLEDCYAYVRHEVSGSNTWTFLPDCYSPVKRASLAGQNDWGAESGRGFYERVDTHIVLYSQFLMFGSDSESIKDIPDGSVFSLKDGAETTNDVWYAEIGAEGIKTNNVEVYSQ